MERSASENDAREALLVLRNFLSGMADGSAESSVAARSLQLLDRYSYLGMNEHYLESLAADLAKGIGDWSWSDDVLASLNPLMDTLLSKVRRHVELQLPPY